MSFSPRGFFTTHNRGIGTKGTVRRMALSGSIQTLVDVDVGELNPATAAWTATSVAIDAIDDSYVVAFHGIELNSSYEVTNHLVIKKFSDEDELLWTYATTFVNFGPTYIEVSGYNQDVVCFGMGSKVVVLTSAGQHRFDIAIDSTKGAIRASTGDIHLTSRGMSADTQVRKYDKDGEFLWAAGANNTPYRNIILRQSDGQVYATSGRTLVPFSSEGTRFAGWLIYDWQTPTYDMDFNSSNEIIAATASGLPGSPRETD